MRILQITHQYPPHHIGGVELLTRQLARDLAQRGHEVHVLTRAPGDHGDSIENGVTIHRLPATANPTRRFLATFADAATLAACNRILDDVRPDIVHIQHLMGYPLALIDAIRHRHIPYLVSLHDYWFACANAQLITNFDQSICAGPSHLKCSRCACARAGWSPFMSPAIAPVLAVRASRLKQVLCQAQQVVVNSHFVQDWFVRHNYAATNWSVMSYGLDHHLMTAIAPPISTQTHPPTTFAYVGSLSWQKGVHVLIEAFNPMPRNATLTIAGDTEAFPEYVQQLRKQVQHPGIRFVGALDRAAVWQLLQHTDVVAVPALWHETASLIAREALATGCYVLAAEVGALSELIHRYPTCGRLLPPADVCAWRTALHTLPALSRQPQSFPSSRDYASQFTTQYENAVHATRTP